MGNSDSDSLFSLSSLLCQEDQASLLKEDGDGNKGVNLIHPCLMSENEDEYIENLFKRETDFGSENCSSTTRSWLKSSRLDAIEWILNTRATFGFQFHTVYLSVTYFDRFLSRRSIDEGKLWAVRLLSVACLSLAAKMEEFNAPALSEYAVEDFYFENKVIQRMELLVLSALEWKMGLVTPFAYLHPFIKKICGETKTEEAILSKAAELVVAVIKEINLMDNRPSIIASAAVLVAFDGQLTKKTVELRINVISSWGSQESVSSLFMFVNDSCSVYTLIIQFNSLRTEHSLTNVYFFMNALEQEHVYSCYNIMLEIGRRKIKTPELVISPNLLSMHSSSADIVENPSFTSAAGTKRRLTFGDNEIHSPGHKMNRIN
ncbi:Cyclin [Quillaja saponaria]|uniref:B-like cyclin n=1 Tax=Quillaja saponaria TaxID=32244 RepID=A0AAD7L7A2_QUISA|nr:Cyclin [Quillaja saponaria]